MHPSQPLFARLRLTTKQVGKGYYKGTRSGSMGFFDRQGRYVIDWKKVRTYVTPENFDQFKLTPFVTKRMEPTPSEYIRSTTRGRRTARAEHGLQGKDYLQLWATDNYGEVETVEQLEEEAKLGMDNNEQLEEEFHGQVETKAEKQIETSAPH